MIFHILLSQLTQECTLIYLSLDIDIYLCLINLDNGVIYWVSSDHLNQHCFIITDPT